MSRREASAQSLELMPGEQVEQVLNYSACIDWLQQRGEWQAAGRAPLARAYGPGEPGYTLDDLKRVLNS